MGQPNTQAERLREVSRRRREREKDDLRRRILDAAGELFLEHGYEGLSMRQIAERIGYSATTIYRYYEDKDDLLYAIVHDGFLRFGRQLAKAAQSSEDPRERLAALGHAYIEFGLRNPVYYRMMFMQRSDFLFDSRAEQKGPMIDSFGVLRQSVEQAMESGALRRGDPETTSTVIWAVVHGITSLALAGAKRFNKKQVRESADLAMRMIRDGLGRT
ncbi:MAG TPA: TetR/AcrR family transcriptional regulator [Pyrinomonadaceae bacterium]|nr:TetR/AcrR family transcriptional regulator [Pyrinomonadaceae bacterium]